MRGDERAGARLRSARGAALMGVMMLLAVLSALAAAMTVSGQAEIMVARNTVSAAQAGAAAEAGLNHATEVMIPNLQQFAANGYASVSAAMTGLIVGPDNQTGTAATDADNGSLENLGIVRPPAQLALAGQNGVGYEARVFDDDDPARGTTLTAADIARIGEDGNPLTDTNSTLAVQVIGHASNNTRVVLEASIANSAAVLPAVVVGGTLDISGNPTITGTRGGVHANDDLDITGSPDIAQDATAGGAYTESGNPTIGGITGGAQGTLPIPPISAIDYVGHADFILTSGGQMTDQPGAVICDASADNQACASAGYGWVFGGGSGWSIPGNGHTDGTYYVQGDATVSGNHGNAANPFGLTLIAEGSIQISGNSDITPDTPELLFVTDGDLKITGTLETDLQVEGAILVHEQLELAGNATLSGQIIVEDAADNHSLVSVNRISGNATISYNGTLGGGAGVGLFTLNGWREVR